MKEQQSFLKNHYQKEVVKQLMQSRGYKNCHQVPAIEKVVLNSSIGADADKTWIAEVQNEIAKVAGQMPVITKARKSISNFKLREGMPIGVKVTLRGDKMYDFLYRLIVVSLPRIRDFRGVGRKLDGSGNYNLGVNDHTIFPEINVEGNRKNIGMDITIVTSAKTDDEALELLTLMGIPFRKPTSHNNPSADAA